MHVGDSLYHLSYILTPTAKSSQRLITQSKWKAAGVLAHPESLKYLNQKFPFKVLFFSFSLLGWLVLVLPKDIYTVPVTFPYPVVNAEARGILCPSSASLSLARPHGVSNILTSKTHLQQDPESLLIEVITPNASCPLCG